MSTLESLTEATKPWNYGKKIDWNPDLHPRDRKGRFRDVFKSILKLLEGDYMDLDKIVADAPHIKSAYVWRTKDGWELRGTSDSGTYGILITPEQLNDNEHEFEDALKTLNADPPFPDAKKCGCGCGAPVKGNYLPGHDARHKSSLVKAALLGDENARATLAEKNWLKFLDKTPEKNKPTTKVETPEQNTDFDLPDDASNATPIPEDDPFAGKPDPELEKEFEDAEALPPIPESDPGSEEDKPPMDADEAGWQPSDEEEEKALAQDLADEAENLELDEDSEDEYENSLNNVPENYTPDSSTDTIDDVLAAVDGNNDKYADVEPYPDLDTCNCGCGGTKSPTAKYLPGHDSRHKSALVKAAKEGDKRAYVTLAQKGWLKFLDKALGKASTGSKVIDKKGEEKWSAQELEYDPSRVPAGMPISDDYANYQLLDPGPGDLEEQLERLTIRRDTAKSIVDRNMLNETMFRLRGGHTASMEIRPSRDLTQLRGATLMFIMADLGYVLPNADDYLTATGNVRYSYLRRLLGSSSPMHDQIKEKWKKKNRKSYEEKAEQFLDDYALEGDFVDQAGERYVSLYDRAVASGQFNPLQIISFPDRNGWLEINNFSAEAERIKAGETPSRAWLGGSQSGGWQDYFLLRQIEGLETNPRADFFTHVGLELEDVFEDIRKTGDVNGSFAKRDMAWAKAWIDRIGMIPMPGVASDNITRPGVESPRVQARDIFERLANGEEIHPHMGLLVGLHMGHMTPSGRQATRMPEFANFYTEWWGKQNGRDLMKFAMPGNFRAITKHAMDYQRTKAIGSENTLVSEAPSHDISLEDQIINESTARDIFAMDAPDRGRAIFMRDTPFEDDYIMVHGHAQRSGTTDEIDVREQEGFGQYISGFATVNEAEQQTVIDALLEKGAEIKQSKWKLPSLYGSWSEKILRKAMEEATSVQLDLGDGKLIEYVPEATSAKNNPNIGKDVKKFIDENVGNGKFIMAQVKMDDSGDNAPFHIVFDTDGNLIWMPHKYSFGVDYVAKAKEAASKINAEGKQLLHNEQAGFSNWGMRRPRGQLLFRYIMPNGTYGGQTFTQDTDTHLGESQDSIKKRLNESLAEFGLKIDTDVEVLERNPKLNTPFGLAGQMSYARFNDLFIGKDFGGEDGPVSGTENFKYNVYSQRRQLKFTGMTPKEITDWISDNLGGSVEPKVPMQQLFGGNRREGRPSILQDAYADGSVKPDFEDKGIVHMAGGGNSQPKDLWAIISSGGIMSISEKIQRRQWGRNIGGGMSPQGDIASGLDGFAFGNLGQGITYGGGKIRIIYRTETAMRRDALVTNKDFGGGSNRFSRYKTYMQKWGGEFGRSIPVENITGARVNGTEWHAGSNEFNLKHELPTEDIAAIMVPRAWGEPPTPPDDILTNDAARVRHQMQMETYEAGKAEMDKVREYLAKVNPDAKIIYVDTNYSLEEAKQFIKEHNIATGFHRAEGEQQKNGFSAQKINVGDMVMVNLQVGKYDNLDAPWGGKAVPIEITRVEPDGRIKGKVMVEKLKKFSPTDIEELKQGDDKLISETTEEPIEFEVQLNQIRWLRTPLKKMVDVG